MKTFLTAIVLLVAAHPLCSIPSPAKASQAKSPCSESVLPASLQELVGAKFSGWRPKQLSDMDQDDQKFWTEGPHAKDCPGIAVGHFESADDLSYAILLVPKSKPDGGHKIVVFGKPSANVDYVGKLIVHAEGGTYSGLVVSKAEPGKYSSWDSTKAIQIKLDGVYVEWMEKGAQLFYWSNGRYRKLQVSD